MGLGRTGGNHNAVEVFLADHLGNGLLGIRGAGKQIISDIFHIGKGSGEITYLRDINHPRDIDATLTDEYTDAGPFTGRTLLLRDLYFLG